jgi:hypothetical protein
MTRKAALVLTTTALLYSAATAGEPLSPIASDALTHKEKVVFKVDAANSKYTQQHVIDVGDVPGHQVRLFEIRRTFPKDLPLINGMKIVESWTRGLSDHTNNDGAAIVYHVYIAENGDRFFGQSFNAEAPAGQDRKLTTTMVGTITGGTGKFSGIRGLLRVWTTADLKEETNEAQIELEYWFG